MGPVEPASTARNGDRFLVPVIFEPLARLLLDEAGLEPGDRVLDLACATGTVARCAEEGAVASGLVVGLDPDMARLRVGMERVGAGWRPCRARSETLPFRDAAFSLVACQHGLMFFSDLGAALVEARRVLRPGGRLVASGWRAVAESSGFQCLNRALADHAGDAVARAAAVPFSLPDPEAVERQLREAGFVETRSRSVGLPIGFPSARAFVERFVGSTSLAHLARDRPEALAAVTTAVCRELGGNGDALAFQGAAHLLRASVA